MTSSYELPFGRITPFHLNALRAAGKQIDLIDVRTPAEYRTVHALNARLVPLDKLDPKKFLEGRQGAPDDLIYVICQSGTRGRIACDKFQEAGFFYAINVEGGTQAWIQAGLPVERGKPTMSLERQVRILAGSLVVIGTTLGAFLHPYFLGLSAFIGSGLVFAGLTDTCGMGMMLAKMPWNQAADSGQCSTN